MSKLFRIWFASFVLLASLCCSVDAATLLFRTKGTQFLDDSGNPLAGGKVYYYEAGTTTLQTTYSDSAGTTPNANPLTLDSAGRLTTSIYFGDSDSFSDYKELLQSSVAVTVSNWPVDNLPAATPAETAAAFAPPLLAWTQVTSAASPVTLTASDAGKAYEADTTSGNIEFDLPSAASVGDGKGFLFKKTVAANSMIVDPSGSETIDNSSTSLTVTGVNAIVGIFSNGAEWYRIESHLDGTVWGALLPGLQSVQVFTSSGTWTKPSGIKRIIAIGTGGGGGGGGTLAGSDARSAAGGGGGGTCIEVIDVSATTSETVTIGAGGAGGTGDNNGTAGGDTTFGSNFTAGGGPGGTKAANGVNAATVAGGTATGGSLNIVGGQSIPGFTDDSLNKAAGGSGGGTFWGNGGAGAVASGNGTAATVFGTGGGGGADGATTARNGSAGKDGIVVVFEFGSN